MKILILSTFTTTPSNFGGAQRTLNLASGLADYDNKVRVVGFSSYFDDFPIRRKDKVIRDKEGFKEIEFRDSLLKFVKTAVKEKIGVDDFRLLQNEWINNVKKRKREIISLADWADIVLVNNPRLYFSGLKEYPLVYSSHNFEYGFLNKMQGGTEAEYVREKEKRLAENSDLVLSVTEEDKNKFLEEYVIDSEKVVIVPNGADFDKQVAYDTERREDKAIFIGSDFEGNRDAIDKIISVAETLQDLKFIIVGGISKYAETNDCPENVDIKGKVEDQKLEEMYKESLIALNPIKKGSGSNIKLLEYLEYGLPTISTYVGARGGFGEKVATTSYESFIDAVKELKDNDDELMELHEKSKTAKEYYDWNNIAKNLDENLKRV